MHGDNEAFVCILQRGIELLLPFATDMVHKINAEFSLAIH